MSLNTQNIVKRIKSLAGESKRKNKKSLFCLASTRFSKLKNGTFGSLRETDESMAETLFLTEVDGLVEILTSLDGLIDYVVVDVEGKRKGFSSLEKTVRKILKKTGVLTYRPNEFSASSLDAVLSVLGNALSLGPIAIIGCGHLGSKLALMLAERGLEVRIYRRNKEKRDAISVGINHLLAPHGTGNVVSMDSAVGAATGAGVVVGATDGEPIIGKDILQVMHPRGFVVDAGTNNIDESVLSNQTNTTVKFLCLNVLPGYRGAIKTLFESLKFAEAYGKKNNGSLSFISGGYLGKKGDIVVDDFQSPTRIIGIADGHGDLLDEQGQKPYATQLVQAQKYLQNGTKREET